MSNLNSRIAQAERTINVKVAKDKEFYIVLVDEGVYSMNYKDEKFKGNLAEYEKFKELHGIAATDDIIIHVIKA